MTERPILYTGSMVRAVLDDRKTQTRRNLKMPHGLWETSPTGDLVPIPANCPYGQPGGRLWVRETFFAWGRWETRFSAKKGRDEWHFVDMTSDENPYLYAADGYSDTQMFIKRRGDPNPMYWKRPAIFMPRVASRITLEVTGVRVERLQDISIEDAKAEGAWGPNESIVGKVMEYFGIDVFAVNPINAYQMLWESINGPGSWDLNPWVWVIEFRRAAIGGAK